MTVAELLDSPEKWTQGAWARDKTGMALKVSHSGKAVCWCLLGAFLKVYIAAGRKDAGVARERLNALVPGGCLVAWNDEKKRTFSQVRALVLKAGV